MIKEKLKLVPHKPGSYQMKNKDGIIIYVGKAKDLKNRLTSYFTGTHTGKTLMLVNDIVDFEYIVTTTELESLILEITLIKKYNPKYNILLKDDKTYPYIELSNDKYPSLKIVRNINRKKNKTNLFGPYPNVSAARKTVNIINRVYPLRKCINMKKDVCLYYHINECLGYCKKQIDQEYLKQMTNEIISFLKGDASIITTKIEKEMKIVSENLNFERALELKTMLEDINITLIKQKIDLNNNYNFDLFNYYRDNNYLSIQVFFIRNGVLFGRDKKIINVMINEEEDMYQYIIQFYEKNNLLPKKLIIPNSLDLNLLSNYLNIKVESPSRGTIKKLLDMALDNCKEALKEDLEIIKRNEFDRLDAIKDLKDILKKEKVSRVEAFDNSHLFGTFYVGGMVVFEDFLPIKNDYRKFKLDLNVKDDLSAMREVVYRRYYRLMMENSIMPDLIVVDGGELQVKTVKEILNSLNLNISILGLKKDDKHRTYSLIDENLNTINIDRKSNLFLFLTKIQEEVHNYAITYHRTIKSHGTLSSLLDMVEGIGPKRKKMLLKEFGSLKKMKEANINDFEKILTKEVSQKLYDYLKNI